MAEKAYKIHETSLLGDNVRIGDGTRVWQFCNIMDHVEIGENCNIGMNVFIETGVKIGDRVTIKNNISIYSGVECEDDTFLGPNCVFTNVLTPRSFISRKNEFKKTIVHKGATLCANCTIVCGHDIGRYAMVGAGAVVTKTVPDYTLVAGNPAKKIGYVCECGERIYADADGVYKCMRCGKTYRLIGEDLTEFK
ncbi:MAG: acyltransferase [Oscillospiraceae bacterium]